MKAFLGDISEIQVGYQSREGIRAHPDGSHFLLQARDFNTLHQVDWSNLTRFTPAGSTTKSEIREGDVLFLAKGQENFACPVTRITNYVLAANSFYILRSNQATILPDYLAWWLNQAPAQEYIQLNRSGSSLPFLSVSALSHLEIPVPDFEMQRKIGELELLRKKEADLLGLYLSKKSALIKTVCLNAIIE
ncbi:MAG TPA: restriction endonuclease subunit S [Anaerolineaceae bacterium]|nr:restriction endonuclease subunit S [Anaerolineaceae bacterium]